ncbi:MAG: acylphosphatase [Candidatus Altiarchaeia archaeon]
MDKRMIIEGARVHGVGFRPFLYVKARKLRLTGFEAENVCINGLDALDVSFSGDEKAVLIFSGYCRTARPPEALVSGVREEEPPESVLPIDEYDRILAAEQQGKMVQSGLTMIGMQEKTVGLQEKTLEKLDVYHDDNVKRFELSEERFERIIKNLERILDEMREDRMEARKSTERIITMISSMRPGGLVRERPAAYSAVKKAKGTRKK